MSLCECGCGNSAPLSTQTRSERGQRKGEPVRFINGHNRVQHTTDAKSRISAALRQRVVSEQTRKKLSESKRRDRNPSWRGGRFVRHRRVQVYVGLTHPMANSNGYVFEHRLVMAGVIGRPLRSDEHVHHLDLNPLNNDPENLVILSPSTHSRLHRYIDQCGMAPAEAFEKCDTGFAMAMAK